MREEKKKTQKRNKIIASKNKDIYLRFVCENNGVWRDQETEVSISTFETYQWPHMYI